MLFFDCLPVKIRSCRWAATVLFLAVYTRGRPRGVLITSVHIRSQCVAPW